MKKLDILVPHYHEPAEVIKPLLDSIAIQQNVDFNEIGVIICHDGAEPSINSSVDLGDYYPSEVESKEFEFYDDAGIGGNYSIFTDYPFEIKQIHIPHKGVSAARNAALDASDAEYVMWCDCDDMFFNACGLWVAFRDIAEHDPDTFVSAFLEESRTADTGKPVYLVHTEDATFVHGKIHRRQYLIDKGIRWDEKLTIHEDSYFNILAQSLTEKRYECPTAFYLWKYRTESVCRHDQKYMLKTYHHMIDSNDALIEEFRRRGEDVKLKFYVVLAVMDAYYTMNKKEWIDQENKEYRDSTERRFAEYFRKYRDVWDSVSDRDKMKVSNNVRARSIYAGMGMESVTIADWLNHIETLN